MHACLAVTLATPPENAAASVGSSSEYPGKISGLCSTASTCTSKFPQFLSRNGDGV
jgi:hypothetical protein